MISTIAIFALLAAAAVYFASVRHKICLGGLLLGSAVVVLVCAYLLFVAPDDLTRYQQVYPTVFHPWFVGMCLSLGIVAFSSLSLGLFGRCLVTGRQRWRRGH
jgi:hypothetical protein